MKKILLPLLLTLALFATKAQDVSDSIHVTHYAINLDVTDFTNRVIQGHTDLSIVTKVNSLSQFALYLQGLTVDSVVVADETKTFTHQGMRLFINHASAIGDTTLVRVYYHGTPVADTRWGGFYYSGQYCYNMGVAFTDQPHNFGRCWFPCLDVFTDKSSYTMHIRTEPGKMAVCNGLLTDSLTLSDSSRVWTWELEEVIPTYLASMAVGPYRLYADTFQGMQATIPIEIYAQPSTINNVAGSFVNLKRVLRMYESLFGPYRWPRVGYVAVNFTSGAMEHATNIAYPNSGINGTLSHEDLYAHELFHLWFGDLITCNQAEQMWINEGFASYAEALTEGLLNSNDSTDAYLNYIRDVHHATLKDIVKDDGAHYALDNVPQEVTYGTHSYQKGSLIVHTLRNYMGDSLFFSGFQQLLDHYAYQNINSEELFSYLTQVTGMPLHDFYEAWVHQPGFLHFSIDSIRSMGGNQYRVYLHQKLCGATHFGNSNKLDLTFVSSNRELFTVEGCSFSGEFGSVEVTLPFVPMFGMVDYFEKITDATIDYTLPMVSGQSKNLTNAYCTVKLDNFPDTVLVRVEHNMVTPDIPEQLPEGIYRLSSNHYWNIQFAHAQNVNTIPTGQLQFKFQKGVSTSPDQELFGSEYTAENLKLLYREDASMPWRIIEATRSGSPNSGNLKTEQFRAGQYCFAMGDVTASVDDRSQSPSLHIYPNPAGNTLNIHLDGVAQNSVKGAIYDTTGRILRTIRIKPGSNAVDITKLTAGTYVLGIGLSDGRIATQLFVKE
ncbi:MAG: T9SS type A sorting domain-containing protein [Bacteroidales bacterium]|nr:T9SS type A sorting domain-containing protein [Bacteroidales bacterium]